MCHGLENFIKGLIMASILGLCNQRFLTQFIWKSKLVNLYIVLPDLVYMKYQGQIGYRNKNMANV